MNQQTSSQAQEFILNMLKANENLNTEQKHEHNMVNDFFLNRTNETKPPVTNPTGCQHNSMGSVFVDVDETKPPVTNPTGCQHNSMGSVFVDVDETRYPTTPNPICPRGPSLTNLKPKIQLNEPTTVEHEEYYSDMINSVLSSMTEDPEFQEQMSNIAQSFGMESGSPYSYQSPMCPLGRQSTFGMENGSPSVYQSPMYQLGQQQSFSSPKCPLRETMPSLFSESKYPLMGTFMPSRQLFEIKISLGPNTKSATPQTGVSVKLAPNTWATPCILVDAQPSQGTGTVRLLDEVTTNLDYGFQFTRDSLPNMVFTSGKLGTEVSQVNAKVSILPSTGYLPRNDVTGVILYTGLKSQDFYLEAGTRVSIPAGIPFYIGEEEETFTKDTVVTLL